MINHGHHIWVCLKMFSVPLFTQWFCWSWNPVFRWLAIIGKINPTFSDKPKLEKKDIQHVSPVIVFYPQGGKQSTAGDGTGWLNPSQPSIKSHGNTMKTNKTWWEKKPRKKLPLVVSSDISWAIKLGFRLPCGWSTGSYIFRLSWRSGKAWESQGTKHELHTSIEKRKVFSSNSKPLYISWQWSQYIVRCTNHHRYIY